jgi:hypothetical protein
MVGAAYAQLLGTSEPELNVAVGSPREPLATQGTNAFVAQQVLGPAKPR